MDVPQTASLFNTSRIPQVSFSTLRYSSGGDYPTGLAVTVTLIFRRYDPNGTPAVALTIRRGEWELTMDVIEMRERGVYVLPDGREVIALKGGRFDFFKLYDPLAWKYLGPALYETDAEGRITSLGRPTPWRVEDLKDAGHDPPQRH